ncbi:MAG: restriction endonuclease subunit S, partial [Bacilli bacterium]
QLASGSTIKEVRPNIIKKIKFLLPPIPEQNKIAEILSCVDEDIEKTDEMIKKTQKLKKGLMQEFFAKNKENYTKIADLAEVFTGGTPNTTRKEYWGGGIKWMSSGEVNLRRVYDTKKTITQEGLDNSNARLLPTGTVMVALAGQGKTRGKAALLEVESTCNQSLAAIIAHPVALNNEFLFFNFEYRYEELRNISGGEGRAGLNLRIIKDILIPVPNMLEQKKIVGILSAVDDKINIYKQIKRKLTELKKGLMQDLLSGEIRVKI